MDILSTGHIPIGFRTPGYPMVLALCIGLFGVKLVLLKATSFVFFLGIIFSVFYVFRNRIHTVVLFPLLLFIAINPLLLEYAHQTYSEILFGLLLVWTIHFIMRSCETESIMMPILTAVLCMISFYIRVAGVTLAGSAMIFFLFQRRWKQLIAFLLACGILYSPMKIYEWTSGATAFGQASILLLKNPYNTLEGTETFSGFIGRFINNIFNYANYQIPTALGFSMPQEIASADGRLWPIPSAFFGTLLSMLLFIGFISFIIYQRKSVLALLGYFILIYISFVSLALQNLFATPRMLVPIIPFLCMGTLEGVRWIGNRFSFHKRSAADTILAKRLVLTAWAGLLLVNMLQTEEVIENNLPIVKANLGGNELAGFTDDWANYIRAAQWIKSNLPVDSTRVICRKPEFFSLYAGNYVLEGVYKIDQVDPDSIVARWKYRNMTHVLYDNFQWSSTLRRYIQPVAEKYPQMFQLVHQEGTQFPSYVFRLNYKAMNEGTSQRKDSPR